MKKNIALIAGGDSGEYTISINSAKVIRQSMDADKYNVFLIVIAHSKWLYLNNSGVESPVDKNDFSVIDNGTKVKFDCALITIHGTPGEDGKLQGYLDLLAIPYTTSGVLGCAVTFNKHFCKALVSIAGVQVARSTKYHKNDKIKINDLLSNVSLPVFVKPNKGGSSLGTSFVRQEDGLIAAINSCFEHDDEALIEEFIEGTELTCGVYSRKGEIIVLPVTEIVSKSAARFFDYEAKYTKDAAEEITPARIDDAVFRSVQETTRLLYQKLELKGVCRLDYIYGKKGLFFLEANITPGMSKQSIVPQQAAYVGISMGQLFDELITEALNRRG